jgi:sulfite reductase alpha subunit-like flavoprotein
MKLYILYGSQTGTAEEVAYDLARESSRRRVPVEVSGVDDFDLENLLLASLVVFVVSTTGQGEPPSNMCKFWKAVMKKGLPVGLFSNMNYTVFGLGDSSYENYNVIARKLFIRLKQLGATPICDKGLGDDLHDFGYEAEYHPWCQTLWQSLQKFFPLLNQMEYISGLLPPMYDIKFTENENYVERNQITVVDNTILSDKYTYTKHLVFENREFVPGDTLAVYPPNLVENVEIFMKRMGWDDRVIEISCNPDHPFIKKSRFPRCISIKKLLLWYVDLHKPVSRYFIEVLGFYASGLHKEKLEEMSSKTLEGRNEYHRYITKEKRNAIEVLWDFSSIKSMHLAYFLESVGQSKYREFSISNSPNNLEILVSVINHRTPLGRTIPGLCTHYLSSLQSGDKVYAEIKSSKFLYPPTNSPVLLICTGTGLAPIRSVLLTRCNANIHDNLLFFGTRHPDYDYYFKQEIESLQTNQKLQAFVAFSQTIPKKYVQDLIKENWKCVVEYINNKCYVLICGKYRQLLKTVKKAFVDCLDNVYTHEESENIIKIMTATGRIYSENW